MKCPTIPSFNPGLATSGVGIGIDDISLEQSGGSSRHCIHQASLVREIFNRLAYRSRMKQGSRPEIISTWTSSIARVSLIYGGWRPLGPGDLPVARTGSRHATYRHPHDRRQDWGGNGMAPHERWPDLRYLQKDLNK